MNLNHYCSFSDEHQDWPAGTVGSSIERCTDLEGIDGSSHPLALIFVNEFRKVSDSEIDTYSSEFRDCLFGLHFEHSSIPLLDLGDLINGERPEDTTSGLSEIVSELLARRILPLIIGIDDQIMLSVYEAFAKAETIINMGSISPRLMLNESGLVSTIINRQPNFLFNYSNIGYQTYLSPHSERQLLDELYFDALRLGNVRGQVDVTEPVLRNCDFIAMDLASVKSVESGDASNEWRANGLYAEEACQLAHYSGANEKTKAMAIYGWCPKQSNQGAAIAFLAELVWCFVQGFIKRPGEMVIDKRSDGFLTYQVSYEHNQEDITFLKSLKSDRWWIEVQSPPAASSNQYMRHMLVPCSYSDYLEATKGEVPQAWWNTYKKLL